MYQLECNGDCIPAPTDFNAALEAAREISRRQGGDGPVGVVYLDMVKKGRKIPQAAYYNGRRQ